jgi:hypothetical protein
VGECYAPRPIRFRELLDTNGYRLKVYEILYGYQEFDATLFAQALKLYSKELPVPPITDSRPGVGFIIFHQGRGWYYFVLCWWDNENELVQKVFVRKVGKSEKWKPASLGQSVCVWDLEIIWFERNTYIDSVLSGGSIEEYLSRHFVQTKI